MLSTLNRTEVFLSRWAIEIGLTLSVICGSSKRLPSSDPFGFEGKVALRPVKDRSRNVPVSKCAEVFNLQGAPLGRRNDRRRSHEKDLQGTVRALTNDRRLLEIPGLNW